MIKTWQAVDGGTDGMDRSIIGTFTSEADAKKAAAGRGVMGHGDGTVQEGPIVYESFKEFVKKNPAALRERALAKLTKEERRLLGLRDT